MSAPLSICDISARYGQMPAPQQTVEEQTGWNPKQLFLDYMRKFREQRKQNAEDAEEDALMAMIDAMNASEEDIASGRTERTLVKSLARAGKAIAEQSEEILDDGTKRAAYVDPMTHLSVHALLSCLGDRFSFEQADEVQENIREAQELREREEQEEERLEVTEQRDLSDTGNPSDPMILERR